MPVALETMQQYWFLFFGLCASYAFATPSTNLANDVVELAETDHRQVGIVDHGQAEQQHPIAVVDNASVKQTCAVCEGVTQMVGTSLEEPFRATIAILSNSREASCQVHAPLRQHSEQYSYPQEPEKPETVYLGKEAGDPRLMIYFERSGQGPYFDLLEKPDSQRSSSSVRSVKLLDPEWIDLEVVKAWVRACEKEHGETCASSPFASGYDLQRPAYLIDALVGCLVDTSSITGESLPYVALSHPQESPGHQSDESDQNDQRYLVTTTANLAQLQEPGALLSPAFATNLTAVFRDVIEFVRLLEYRYIWIPSLCIIQDDPSIRAAETAKVADILVGAVFSINQPYELKTMQGLRGIRELKNPQPRNLVQSLHPWGEETLVVSVGQRVADCQRRAKTQGIRDVRASALYLQDAFLPHRQLRFGHGSVEWRCRSCSAWEETARFCDKNCHSLRSPDSVLLDPRGQIERYRAPWTDALSLPWFSIDHYFHALNQLTELDSSAGGETLDVAAGVISRLATHSQGSLLCGMPEERLDIALLFSVSSFGASGGHGARRREVGPPLQPDLPWPSWSWAGWTGPVLIDPTMRGTDYIEGNWQADIIPIVEWYASDSPSPDAPRRRLETRLWDDAKQRFQHNGLEPVPAGWARKLLDLWDIDPNTQSRNQGRPGFDNRVTYTRKSLPGFRFAYPIPMGNAAGEPTTNTSRTRMTTERFLSGVVNRVFLYIHSSEYRSSYLGKPLPVYSEMGQHVGVLRSTGVDNFNRLLGLPTFGLGRFPHFSFEANRTEDAFVEKVEARVEVIALSKNAGLYNNLPEFRSDEFYNVMWIEWTDGVAYRKGIGRVVTEFWEQLQPESIDLILG